MMIHSVAGKENTVMGDMKASHIVLRLISAQASALFGLSPWPILAPQPGFAVAQDSSRFAPIIRVW
jgi:hypothetical protein